MTSGLSLTRRVLCIGGEDHHLRIPFMLELQQAGYQVTAGGTGNIEPFRRAQLEYEPFFFHRFVTPLADLATIRQIRAIFDRVQPAIVQSFDTKPNVLVPIAAQGRSSLLSIRTINGMGWVYSSLSPAAMLLRPVQQALHRHAGRTAAATVFQNKTDKAFFERAGLIGNGRSVLIAGSGVDIARFDKDSTDHAEGERLRNELGLGSSRVVMTVARLTRQKGITTLLKAAALVHRALPDVRFLLVGPRESEGRFAVSAEEFKRHAPYVMVTGPRNDVPALLRLADVFAFPTEYREGVPRSLLEAALAKAPIVTTDMPGCIDVVRHGHSGLIVPTRSPRALADGILQMLGDPQAARVMAKRASERVRAEFGLDLTVSRYVALYEALLSGRSPLSVRPCESGQWTPLGSCSNSV